MYRMNGYRWDTGEKQTMFMMSTFTAEPAQPARE
jgi:hypothetical protein